MTEYYFIPPGHYIEMRGGTPAEKQFALLWFVTNGVQWCAVSRDEWDKYQKMLADNADSKTFIINMMKSAKAPIRAK